MHHTLLMRKKVKAGLAVVVANAALANAAKRQFHIGQMSYRIVDAASAQGHGFYNLLFYLVIGCKQIKRQRFGMVLHSSNRLLYFLMGMYGPHGSDSFFLHSLILPAYILPYGGTAVELIGIGLSARDSFLGIDHLREAVEVVPV